MPYKDRETYLRKQREFHARRKARAQNQRAKLSLTPATSYAQKTRQGAKSKPRVSNERVPIQPESRVSCASVPLTPLTRRKQKNRGPVLARERDPNKGIALLFEPTAKEKFQVDDCGNAWRILGAH